MISNKTLLKWRKESLSALKEPGSFNDSEQAMAYLLRLVIERDERILRLTQELMDINLLEK